MTRERARAITGMIVALGSLAMSATALLLSFAALREGADGWPPAALGAGVGAYLGGSAIAEVAASGLVEWGRRARRGGLVVLAAAFAAIHAIGQGGALARFASAGAALGEPAESMVFVLFGYQAALAAALAAALCALAPGARRRWRRGEREDRGVLLASMGWHFAVLFGVLAAAAVYGL